MLASLDVRLLSSADGIWLDMESIRMHEALEPTQDAGWVLSHEGYNLLTESAVESRFAFGNGFLGMRAARSVSRGPTWVGWLVYVKWRPGRAPM